MDNVNNFYKDLLENMDDGVYYVDQSRKIMFWNKAAEKITGFKKSEVENLLCYDNILEHVDDVGNHLCQTKCPLAKTIEDGEPRKERFYLHHKEGHRVPISIRVFPIKNHEGMILGALETFCENSEFKSNEEKIKELARLAYIDEVTGLPNRNYLNMKRESLHKEMQEMGDAYGIVMLRISNYGSIVENNGHKIAEIALKVVTKTLLGLFASRHVVGRWDETVYMGILPNTNDYMLKNFKTKCMRLIERSSVCLGNRCIQIRATAKIALSNPKESAQALLQRIKELPYTAD